MGMDKVFAVGMILILLGCGGGESKTFDTGPVREDRSGSATAPSDDPDVGDKALRIGEKHDGPEFDTTLREVKFPFPAAPSRVVDDPVKDAWLGMLVEQCMDKNAPPASEDDSQASTYNGEWAVLSDDGYEHAGTGNSWNDWPEPKFPESVGMIPGRCSKGWMALEVPKDTQIKAIQYRPIGTPVAEWVP